MAPLLVSEYCHLGWILGEVDTALETVVEVSLAAATGQHLRG